MMINIFKAEWFLTPQLDYLVLLQNFRILSHGFFDSFFLFITRFGEWTMTIPVIACFYWAGDAKGGAYVLLNTAYGGLINQFLKMTQCIYRPWVLDNDIKPLDVAMQHAKGYSFPSGHTDKAITVWGSFAVLNWKNNLLKIFFILMVLLVAFSRNYLGVHTPQDILVSVIIGVFILFGVKKLMLWVEEKENRDIWVLVASYLLTFIVLYVIYYKSYPIDYLNGKILVNALEFKPTVFMTAGYSSGVFTGLFLTRRFISFDASFGTLFSKILRCILGLMVIFFIINYTSIILVSLFGECIGGFICNLIIGLFITAIYPFLINLISKGVFFC